MTNMFDFNELNNTLLPPCAFQTLWSVNKEKNEFTTVTNRFTGY